MLKTYFTTGEAAKILECAPRTVSKHFDSGRLKGYRIPGSQDRRIPREQFLRFLKRHGRARGLLETPGDKFRGMYVGNDEGVAEGMKVHETLEIASYGDIQTAYQMLDKDMPMCVIIDYVTLPDAEKFRTMLEKDDWKSIVCVVGIGRAGMTDHGDVDKFYVAPTDWTVLGQEVNDMIFAKYLRK